LEDALMATLKPIPAKRPAAKAKPVAAPKAVASKPAQVPPATTIAPAKPKQKQKLIRDSFTIPKNEYLVLDALKQRALGAGRAAKKSEILRAGITVLSGMSDAALVAALSVVPSLKTGRPKDAKKSAPKLPAKKG
jgi:hypothetical protein